MRAMLSGTTTAAAVAWRPAAGSAPSPDTDQRTLLAAGVTVLGPAPAPIALVRGRHRWRFLVKAGREVNIQGYLREWLKDVKPKGSLALQVDVDPYDFL